MTTMPGPIPVVIRDATEEDMIAVRAIYAFYVERTAHSFEEVPPTVNEMRRRRADTIAHGLPYLVAEEDGEILGYSYARHFRERSAYRYTIEDSIYVAPFVTGRGIGKALVAGLVERCEALGYRQMIAVIGDSANAGSIGLHRSLGFRQEGVLRGVGFKFGRWVDVVIMHRTLATDGRPLPDGANAPPLPISPGD